jgi:molecular chaperone GrpE (heat shock protein)
MTERQDDSEERRSAGPVAGQGSSSSPPAAAGEEFNPTPPAEQRSPVGDQGSDVSRSRVDSKASKGRLDAADEVEHDLNALLNERDEYLELAKRTKADFENFRKRATRERSHRVLCASTRSVRAAIGAITGRRLDSRPRPS